MNPLVLLGALGVGAYLLLSQSSSGASGSYSPPNPYGGGGGPPPSDGGGYGGPTNLGSGGSSTPVGPAAVTSSSDGGGYGGPVSSPAPTYITDETTARFPNLATGAGQGMSSYGGESEDASGGFPAAGMSGTTSGPQLRWDPMSRSWY